MKIKKRVYSGTTSPEEQQYEIEHRKIARMAAADGIVLLKNEGNLLPLLPDKKIALYGSGAIKTIKGGSGSGDVNARKTVSVYEALLNEKYHIVNQDWLADYQERYNKERLAWRNEIWRKADEMNLKYSLFNAYVTTPFAPPAGAPIRKECADVALYILSRTAGEGADRFAAPGDYKISQRERDELRTIATYYSHVVLVLNVGGVVDLSVIDEIKEIQSVVYLHQSGMEAGNALVDVLSGKVTPSGKLTDTFAFNFQDYPNSAYFSHNNNDATNEIYHQDIYVGYRYFDTFNIPVRYPFGFGLSYADFEMQQIAINADEANCVDDCVYVQVRVKNCSDTYAGREVVQLYVACDAIGGEREFKRLVAFKKTKLLQPGEAQDVMVSFPLRYLMHFEETMPGWRLSAGEYGVYVGNSVEAAKLCAEIILSGKDHTVQTDHLCAPQVSFDRLQPDAQGNIRRYVVDKANSGVLQTVSIDISALRSEMVCYGMNIDDVSPKARILTDSLNQEQLIRLSMGELSKNQDGPQIGSAGISVPGAAAQTSAIANKKGIAEIALVDGPAGLRLIKEYYPESETGAAVPLDMAIQDGFLLRGERAKNGPAYYQYCTAIPVGTVLAQTWDPEIVATCGSVVAQEMKYFGVTLWLAPGMNIHRNPLCGRNFEYFAQDPLLSGMMAAAMTTGVQQHSGVGVVIKHFACNNQEDNRNYSNSIVSERALREMYFFGFEIAIRTAKPFAVMTSYNLINGIHAANNHDLCTKLLRDEWKYCGLVMTDWGTTNGLDDCSASKCISAGNDSIMPGTIEDYEDVKNALQDGTLSLETLKHAVARLVDIVVRSERYE